MTKTNNTKKVGAEAQPAATEAAGTTDEKKKGRIDFPKAEAKYQAEKDGKVTKTKAINAEGKLIAVPLEYDPRKHKPLTKDDFASVATYLRYQGFVARFRAERFVKIAEDRELKAENLEKFGSELMRKKAAKIDKMKKALKILEAQLQEEGATVDGDADSDKGNTEVDAGKADAGKKS